MVDNDISWQFCPEDNTCSSSYNRTQSPAALRDCRSRQDLERIVDTMFDRLQTSPDIIAKKLTDIGCPFSCSYVSRSVELTMKRHDPKISDSRVRLVFELSNVEEEGRDVVISSVDVTSDMYISDIGTAFGLLLGKPSLFSSMPTQSNRIMSSGLSILDVVRNTAKGLAFFFRSTFTGNGISKASRKRRICCACGTALYWLLLAGLLSALIIAGLLTNFANLLTLHDYGSSPDPVGSSNFLNTANEEVSWSVKGISNAKSILMELKSIDKYFRDFGQPIHVSKSC